MFCDATGKQYASNNCISSGDTENEYIEQLLFYILSRIYTFVALDDGLHFLAFVSV